MTTEASEAPADAKRRGRKLCVNCNERPRTGRKDSDLRTDNLCLECMVADLAANRCPNCTKGIQTKFHLEKCPIGQQTAA